MATQVPVNLVHGGGSLTPKEIHDALCKAFRSAVEEYCKGAVGKRGSFNDKFYEHLRNPATGNPNLAANIAREAPILVARQGSTAVGGTAAALAKAGSPAAQAVHGAHVAALGRPPLSSVLGAGATVITGAAAVGVRSCLAIGEAFRTATAWKLFGDVAKEGLRMRFPDGMIGNQCIEIKGPADSFRPDQKADYDSISDPNPTIVVDCESCNVECKNGPSLAGGWSKKKGCP